MKYKRLYSAKGTQTDTGTAFVQDFTKAIKPVLHRWKRKGVCARDMELLALHALSYVTTTEIHIPRLLSAGKRKR